MAQPIPLEVPPRNPRAELHARLLQAPDEHAEAVLAAYDVLQELHNHGVLEIMRGALAASDELLEKVVDNASTPASIRGIRNLLFWRRILGSIEPEWFQGIFPGNSRRNGPGDRGAQTGQLLRPASATHQQRQSPRSSRSC
jgi:hypothetical protein